MVRPVNTCIHKKLVPCIVRILRRLEEFAKSKFCKFPQIGIQSGRGVSNDLKDRTIDDAVFDDVVISTRFLFGAVIAEEVDIRAGKDLSRVLRKGERADVVRDNAPPSSCRAASPLELADPKYRGSPHGRTESVLRILQRGPFENRQDNEEGMVLTRKHVRLC